MEATGMKVNVVLSLKPKNSLHSKYVVCGHLIANI